MFRELPVLAWLYIAIAVGQIIRLILVRRDHLRRYREVAYEVPDDPEAWRWKKPPKKLHLKLANENTGSLLTLPSPIAGLEIAGTVVGYGVIVGAVALAVWIGIDRGVGGFEVPVMVLVGLLLLAGYGLLHLGSRVVSIELQRRTLTIVTRFGVFLLKRHRFRYRKMQGGTARGHLQEVASMTLWQREPDYWLFLGRPGAPRPAKRFVTSCNQSQGSWIVGGLESWMREGRSL